MMQQLNDLSSIVDNIKEKILNINLDFNSSEVEVILISNDIQQILFEVLKQDYSVWENLSKEFSVRIIECLVAIKQDNDFMLNYYKYVIDNSELFIQLNEEFLEEEYVLLLIKYLTLKLQDPNFEMKLIVSSTILKLIVDENRMDLISKLKGIRNIDYETALKLKQFYINNNEKIPTILHPHLKDLNIPINYLDINALIKNLEFKNLTDEYFSLLLDKLSYNIRISFLNNLENVFKYLNDKQKVIFCKALLDNNYYSGFIHHLNITKENLDFYVNCYITAVNSSNDAEDNMSYYKFNKNYQILLSDDKVVSALIASGKISTASYSPLFKNHIDEVINKVNMNPELFQDYNLNYFNQLGLYPNLMITLIKIGNQSALAGEFCPDQAKEYIRNMALAGKIYKLPNYLINDDVFYNSMIVNGQIDILFNSENILKRTNAVVLSTNAIDYIINRANNDIKFACRLVKHHPMVIINCEKLLEFFLKSNDLFCDILIDKINHLEENLVNYNEKMFIIIKSYIAKKYKLNENHLEQFEKKFGPLVMRYIENSNIEEIINTDENNFSKILGLFPQLEFKMADVEKIYDSLKQFEFSKKHAEDVEIFATINHMIVDDNPKYLILFDKLIAVIDEKFYKRFSIKYPELIDKLKSNDKAFFINLVNKIKSGTVLEKNYYLNILHFITDYYIASKREEYRDSYDMNKDLDLPYELDEKDKIKQFIKCCALKIHESLIIMEMVDLGIDERLAQDCIMYYAHDKRDFSDHRLAEIKAHIKIMVEVANKIIKLTGISPNLVDILDSSDKIKRNYYVESNDSNLFSILMELRLDVLKDGILNANNNDMYQSLLTYIYKYKLHLLPEYLTNLMRSEYVDISLEVQDIASFISYYPQIFKDERKRLDSLGKYDENVNLGFISIMKYAKSYSAISSVYALLLGIEDVKLLKSNPKPNAASKKTQGDIRLKEAVSWTLKNFLKNEVTIPTFNEEIRIDNNISLRAVVGNFTHPTNMTLGERTGACMRIGGAGETLLNFCFEDKNGFHIRFEDPDTGEFISRVSGFRNGNTIFLNELRFSCNPQKFSNKDIVNVCRKVSEMLIEKSKNSRCPIDNIFIQNAYAIEEQKLTEVSFNILNNKKGLKKFYSDIKDKGVVLASTGKPFTPINFDKSNVPSYKPAREIPYSNVDSNKLRGMINRVHAINYALSGMNYEYVEPIEFVGGIVYGIANQDWYIYLDENGNLFEELINNDPRAVLELDAARKSIMQFNVERVTNLKK